MADFRYTPEQVIEALRANHGFMAVAARALGCKRNCIYEYTQKFPEVKAELEHLKELRLDMAEGKLMAGVLKGEAWAICFFLKTQGKARGYTERNIIEHTGEDGGPIKHEQQVLVVGNGNLTSALASLVDCGAVKVSVN